MNKILTIILLFTLSFASVAQKELKYKEIFPYVENENYLVAYSYLLTYQKQDPEFINTYFQLGVISAKWCKEADPLLEYDKVKYFAYNTKLFFGLAKSKMLNKSNEVRKYRKYYQNVPELAEIKKLNNEEVLNYMTNKMAEIAEYEKNITRIYQSFYRVVTSYNKSIEVYRRFLQDYSNLKTIFMMPKDLIYPALDSIDRYFDSTLYAFKNYRAAIDDFPIAYNQHLKLRPIEVYRLDGITSSSLVSETVTLWNYGSWVDNIKDVIGTDISLMRKMIESTTIQMNEKEKFYLKAKKYSDNYQGFMLQDKLVNLIEKYDYRSMMTALLLYRDAKIDYLAFYKHLFNDRNDYSVGLNQRAKNYKILYEFSTTADSLLKIFEQRISSENILKYRDFVKKYYKDGLNSYATDEASFLQYSKKDFLENYKYFICRDKINLKMSDSSVSYNGSTYPLYVKLEPEDTVASVVYKVKGLDGMTYLTGQDAQGPYLMCLTDSMTVLWKNTLENNSKPGRIVPYYGGAVVAATDIATSQTSVYNYPLDGKLAEKVTFDFGYIVRSMIFNDISGDIFVAAKGLSPSPFEGQDGELILAYGNVYNGETKWLRRFKLKGNIVESVRMDTVLHVFVNYSTITISGKEYKANGPQNVGLIRITEGGKFLGFEQVSDKTIFAIDAEKLSSEQINILGFNSRIIDLYQSAFDNLPDLEYFIYNKK